MRIHIVTDSSAHFAHPQLIPQYPVTIVPNRITIAGKTYLESHDLDAERALELITHQVTPPKIQPPSIDEYFAIYSHLVQDNDAIISIHASRMLSDSWEHARIAAQRLMGHLKIFVVDSMALDAAQGMVVRAAIRAIEAGGELDDIVRTVRGAAERTYAIYFVETTDYLMQNKIMAPSHAILSSMLDVKPIIGIEDGELTPMEKVRTRSQAIDRLVEFVVEFTDIEDALILQHKTYMSEQARMLHDRLMLEFPGKHFPHTVYGPTMASLLGPDATGLVVLEKPWEELSEDE